MASILGDLPSFDPHSFSQHRPSDPSNPSRMIPTTYRPTHNRTLPVFLPPPDQVETKETGFRASGSRAREQAFRRRVFLVIYIGIIKHFPWFKPMIMVISMSSY